MKLNSMLCALYSKIILSIHRALSYVLSPHSCLRCGKEASFVLCPLCLHQFENPSLETERCSICGKQLLSEKEKCLDCREEPLLLHIDDVFPIHTYRSWKKELLFQWKICGNRTLSFIVANLFHRVLQKKYPNIPIVPVPPRPGKLFSRGWDQIRDVSTILKKKYAYTIADILIRKEKIQQKKLTRDERMFQMGHLYEIRKGSLIIPEQAVIIDDIMTTGVTLETCARALKNAGVKKVYAVSLFIAD